MRADADGVVVVRREDAAEAVAASQQRIDTEAEFIAAYGRERPSSKSATSNRSSRRRGS